jgi:hypothetical protein
MNGNYDAPILTDTIFRLGPDSLYLLIMVQLILVVLAPAGLFDQWIDFENSQKGLRKYNEGYFKNRYGFFGP